MPNDGFHNSEVISNNGARLGDGGTTNYASIAADGEINLYGTARVTKYSWMPANAVQAAGVKPATITINGSGFIVASFADGQEQQVQCNIQIPQDCDTTENVYVCIGWSSPTISQDCDWEVTWLVTKLNENTDQAGAPIQSYEESSGTANGLVFSLFTIAAANIDSDDLCLHLFIERDGNDANDNLGDVAELHGIALKYTANKLGTAT